MKATIVECVMGVFGFGEANELIERVLFPEDPRTTAERLERIEAGKIVDEVVTVVEKLRAKGYTIFTFENSDLARNAHKELKVRVDVAKPSEAGETLRKNLGKLAVETGFLKQPAELRQWNHRVSMELTKMRIKRAVEKRDLIVVQSIQTIADLDKTLNLFIGRIREWYSLHFPELGRLVEKHEMYTRLILSLEERENFTLENLKKEGLPTAKARKVAEAAEASAGAELEKEDIDQIRSMCRSTLDLYDVRQKLETYVDSAMERVAPNLRALAGSLLGARLIAIAGGLANLAKMPSSTIQLLGAEKALFRALKSGSRPPKHGIIFQHALIHDARRGDRGKMARALAGKLAIAARMDAFSGKYAGDKLQLGLERRISEIKERYEESQPRRYHAKRPSGRRKRGNKS